MTQRSISAIIFSVIVFAEIIIFVLQPTPKITTLGDGGSLFSKGAKIEINHSAVQNRNVMFGIIIGATILIGGVVTFSLPNKSNKDKEG